MPRRRRPPTRGVFSIDDPELVLPSGIALDTSFVVEVLIETQPLHPSCRRFMRQLIESRAAVVTSELLEVELAEATFAIAVKQRWGGQWRRHRTDGRVRRPARRLLADVSMRFDLLVSSLDWISVPVGRISATAATGFALLPSAALAIYTDSSRLAASRSKRPR